jgi:ABC-2 type transport system ATP-binding protein
MMRPAVRTEGLSKRFGAKWALRDCSVVLPEGTVCGLVGANAAGKTTLLRLLIGLSRPSAGSVDVLGQAPSDTPEFLSQVGYLGQDMPLYRRWTADDHLRMGAHLNPSWDDATSREHLRSVGVPLDQRVGTLSGGQRAQVALTVALGKRPRLLLLDEPVAALDPLARRQFLATLTTAVADGDLTVILSSHLVTDLERVCDYVVALAASRIALAGDLESILATHRLLRGPRRDTTAIEREHTVLRREQTAREVSLWVRLNGPLHDPSWQVDALDLEDIVLAYLGQAGAVASPALVAAGGAA